MSSVPSDTEEPLLPSDIVGYLFGFLLPRDVHACSRTCTVWRNLVDKDAALTCEEYINHMKQNYRWLRRHYRSGCVNHVFNPCVDFHVRPPYILLVHSNRKTLRPPFVNKPVLTIYCMETLVRVCFVYLRTDEVLVDLKNDVLVIATETLVVFYDASCLPTFGPEYRTEIHVTECVYLKILEAQPHTVTAHADATVRLWGADGTPLKQWNCAANPKFVDMSSDGSSWVICTSQNVHVGGGIHSDADDLVDFMWEDAPVSPSITACRWNAVADDACDAGVSSPSASSAVVISDGTTPDEPLLVREYDIDIVTCDDTQLLITTFRHKPGHRPTPIGGVCVLFESPPPISALSISTERAPTIVAAGVDDGRVMVWKLSRGKLGFEQLSMTTVQAHSHAVTQIHIDSQKLVSIDSASMTQVWSVPGMPEPRWVVNDWKFSQDYQARVNDVPGLKGPGVWVGADHLIVGPQLLTHQVRVFRFNGTRVPRIPWEIRGPPFQMGVVTTTFYFFLLCVALVVLSVVLHADGDYKGQVVAFPAMVASLLLVAIGSSSYYSPLSAMASGPLYWIVVTIAILVVLYFFFLVHNPPHATVMMALSYLLTIVWRVYYGCVLLTRLYHNRWCSPTIALPEHRSPPPPAPARPPLRDRLIRWYRRSPVNRLLALFMYDLLNGVVLAGSWALGRTTGQTPPAAGEEGGQGVTSAASSPVWVILTLSIHLLACTLCSGTLVLTFRRVLQGEGVPPYRVLAVATYLEFASLWCASLLVILFRCQAFYVWVVLVPLNCVLCWLAWWRHRLQHRVAI